MYTVAKSRPLHNYGNDDDDDDDEKKLKQLTCIRACTALTLYAKLVQLPNRTSAKTARERKEYHKSVTIEHHMVLKL